MAKEVYIKRVLVPLADLCRLWIDEPVVKKNTSAQSVSSGNATSPGFIQKEWRNEKIQRFYSDCVAPYTGSIPENQRNVIEIILELFDKSETVCQTPVISPDDPETSEAHKIIRDCILIDHTLNVARDAHLLHKKNDDHYLSMGSVLIAALSHDIGKIISIQKQFAKGFNNHVLASGQWVQSKVSGVGDYDKIYEAVCYHHAGKRELKARCDPGNCILSILQQANHNVRQREIQDALKKGPAEQKNSDNPQPENTPEPPEDTLIDFSGIGGEGKNDSEIQHGLIPFDESGEKCALMVDNTEPDKEEEFFNWLDENKLLLAVEKNIKEQTLACFHFEGDVYVTVKTFHRLISEFRIERKLPVFNSTEDTRNYLQNKIQRIRNTHCQLKFAKETPRKPYKAYYYIIDAGYFENSLIKNLEPPTDPKGCILSEVKILKEFGGEPKGSDEREGTAMEENR